MKLLLLLPICVQFLGGTLAGQTATTVGVRTLALDTNAANSEKYVKTAEGYELLVFLNRHPGKLVDAYSEETTLPLFEKTEEPDGKVGFKVANAITIPATARSVLILGWGASGNERYLPIDDKFLNASYNDWLMINTSSKPVGFRIGKDEKPFFIKPNSIQNCKVAIPEAKGAAVLGRAEMDGKVRTFYSTYWSIRSGERSIVIFVEQGERIRVRKISDALLEKKESDSDSTRGGIAR